MKDTSEKLQNDIFYEDSNNIIARIFSDKRICNVNDIINTECLF